jgi:hypothetical protein
MKSADTSYSDIELLAEALSLGLKLEDTMPKPKPKPEPKPELKQGGNHISRKKPGDKVGIFTVVRDTGKTNDERCAIYELECPVCHQVREMSSRYALKLKHSCGCTSSEAIGRAVSARHEVERDYRFLRRWHDTYCDPEQTIFTNVRRPGKLALYADMSDRDREMLAETLAAQKTPEDKPYLDWSKFNAAESLLKDRFVEVLDLFQHDQITFPARDVVSRMRKAVSIWLDLKDGMPFEAIGKKYETTAPKIVRFMYVISLRLQITAFVETKYGKHSPWDSPFTEDKWGQFSTVEEIHNRLYKAMVEQGEKHLADHQKKIVGEVITRLEKETELLGI